MAFTLRLRISGHSKHRPLETHTVPGSRNEMLLEKAPRNHHDVSASAPLRPIVRS
jgi:hypothetical protein